MKPAAADDPDRNAIWRGAYLSSVLTDASDSRTGGEPGRLQPQTKGRQHDDRGVDEQQPGQGAQRRAASAQQ